jgi:hypothetical protein
MDLTIDAVLEDGHLIVEPFRCVIGSGTATGRFDLRTQGKAVAMALALEIDKLDLGLMLDDLGVERFITSTVDATIDVEGRGDSVAGLMAGLNGTIVSVVSQGRLNNRYVDVFGAGLLRQILQVINPLTKTENYSELNCLVNHFDIKDGLAESKGLVLDTNHTTVAGSGQINLKTEQLNLVFGLSPKQGVGVSGVGKVSLSLGKLAKNFRLGGTLAKPSLAINPKGTTVMMGKAIGGMALLGLAGLAVALIDVSPGDPNPCLTAIEAVQKGIEVSTVEESEEERGPEEETTKGVRGTLKKLFGK